MGVLAPPNLVAAHCLFCFYENAKMSEENNVTDRKLLELAAKAAEMPPPYDDNQVFTAWISGSDPHSEYGHWWDPLNDDGDALRLANRLCMMVSTGPCEARASTIEGALRGYFPKESTIGCGQDKAVRRVIVMAAAEIGRSMP